MQTPIAALGSTAVCVFLLLASCRPIAPVDTALSTYRGCYHWQTELRITPAERRWLDSLSIDRLYVKFFDLDGSNHTAGPAPQADVLIDTSHLRGLEIVPAIFITNRSLLQTNPQQMAELADRMVERIDRRYTILDKPVPEIQIDCDWSPGSRETYFTLLQQLNRLLEPRGVPVSVTIRLHQLRWPDQTGIPPADRGVLMLYNMGDIEAWQETNSILNLEATQPYLKSQTTYPLPLDIALPLFRWALLFRDGKLIKIINEPADSVLTDPHRFRAIGQDRYEVVQSTYLTGHYLYRQDQLRVEKVTIDQLKALMNLLKVHPQIRWNNLLLYHLDTAIIHRYDYADLRTLYPSPATED